ncbi:MAG: HepT-like ribonuclease domain-containing protein [Terriglobia bacterium]
MSRHSDDFRLRHMLDHAREAVALARDKNRSDLERMRLLQLGLVRLVEIIGEAAARVPKEERMKHSEIPWEDIVGMRNRLIHGYDTVDLDILWNTVIIELPELIQSLEKALPPEAGD